MMMNRYKLTNAVKSAIGISALSFALIGCGSDGKDGEDGENGNIGVDIQQATSLKANILHATVTEGVVAVDFELENANGVPVSGLETFDNINTLGFGIAKLDALQKRDMHAVGQPATPEQFKGVKPTQWTSYINTVKNANLEHIPEGFNHLAGDQIQANIETSCKTECIEVLEHGTYRYTFSKALSEYEQIEAVNTEFNAELTHRVTLELKPTSTFSAATLVNTHYDFVPALDRAAEADETRNLVDLQESCIRCHSDDYDSAASKLMLHGSKRIEIENCVVCHTTYSGDPETGATIDFGSMLHRIHDGTYLMAGYGGSVHDYTGTTFPTDMGNCQTCHINEEHSPAQAENFQFHRQEACASCHMAEFNPVDNAEWLTPPGESKDRGFVGNYFHYYATPELDGVEGADVRGVFENQSCSSCHADDSNPQGAAIFHMAKVNETIDVREQYAYELSNGVFDPQAGTLEFTLTWEREQAPHEDSAINGFWINIQAFDGVEFVMGPRPSSGPLGRSESRISMNLAGLESNEYLTATIEGNAITYTISGITSDSIHTQIVELGQGFIDGKLMVCAQGSERVPAPTTTIDCEHLESDPYNFELAVKGNKASFSVDGSSIANRPIVASEEKCAACHGEQADFSISHIAKYADRAPDNSCGTCHSAEPNTAINLADGSCVACHNSTGAPGHKYYDFSQGFDFKVMIHGIHSDNRAKYTSGNGRDKAQGDITYPTDPADCAACHDQGQLTLAGLADTPPTLSKDGTYSPTVAACASCHAPTAEGNNAVISHFESNGGVYQGSDGSYQLGGESCATCHAEGKSFGVDKVHPTNYK
ncbi:hypothetical protein TUM4445_17890 [Shewanella sp. MBTL60-112-B2]|nr:hypothetical protein TUM4444_14660 [Shewanella sp. MBTL60-112-B1]GIU32339.1 hypothetical protein TUM4445_17890 [Shewanella sp. MBTL60-112-B2]